MHILTVNGKVRGYELYMHIMYAQFTLQLAMIYRTESNMLQLASPIAGLEYGMDGEWKMEWKPRNYS